MKIDFKEYQDTQIKAKKFYEINLKMSHLSTVI